MSSKTKIIVLHLKELIYTGIFALLGILFIVLLIIMFVPKDKSEKTGGAVETPAPSYVPGIYTTSLVLNDNTVDVAVTVDETSTTSALSIWMKLWLPCFRCWSLPSTSWPIRF